MDHLYFNRQAIKITVKTMATSMPCQTKDCFIKLIGGKLPPKAAIVLIDCLEELARVTEEENTCIKEMAKTQVAMGFIVPLTAELVRPENYNEDLLDLGKFNRQMRRQLGSEMILFEGELARCFEILRSLGLISV